MKTVFTERTEMAKALNLNKYPVLSIDMDNEPYPDVREDEKYIVGSKCRVAWDNPRYEGGHSNCYLEIENGRYKLGQSGCCLKATYSLSDWLEDIENANTPLVHKGQIVAIAHYSTKLKMMLFVRLMKVSDRIDTNCTTVATLEEIEE